MSRLNKFTAAIGVAIAICIMAPTAFAKDVLVMDTARIFLESKAGKDLQTKITEIGKSMEAELAPEGAALKTEKAALDAKLQGKTQEQVRADQALIAQGQAYTRKVKTFSIKGEKRARELSATETAALRQFGDKLKTATETVRGRHQALVVLDVTDVYVFDASVDITNEVIQQLDQIAPTISVQRVTLPDQPQSAQQ